MPQELDPKDPKSALDQSGSVAGSDAEPCLTSPLVANFSICLKKDRLCPHALSFGHQYLCRHPDHESFMARSSQK